MQKITRVLPNRGYAVVVDGLVKTEFETQEGATKGARELKGRFPALQIKIYMLARSLIKRWSDIADLSGRTGRSSSTFRRCIESGRWGSSLTEMLVSQTESVQN